MSLNGGAGRPSSSFNLNRAERMLQCPRGCRRIPAAQLGSAVRCLCFFDLIRLSQAYLLQTLQNYVQ